MSRAFRITLVVLALLVIAFAVTWITLPTESVNSLGSKPIKYPARLFAVGILDETTCRGYNGIPVDCGTREYRQGANRRSYTLDRDGVSSLERRVFVTFGAAAVVVVLLAVAFGWRREDGRGGEPSA